MKNLWFENARGERRLIAAVDTWDEVYDCIQKFIDQRNMSKPENKQFKWYYTRTWKEDALTKIDVGSWSEFFWTDLVYEENLQ